MSVWATALLLSGGCNDPFQIGGPGGGNQAVDHTSQALGGSNLGGSNLGGTNLGGTNLGGTNLGGINLGGTNLGGTNLGGTNLGGTNLGGTNLGGTNLGGTNLGGTNLGGTNLGGTNLGGTNLGGTNLGGTNLGGINTGANIHGVGGPVNGMLYSGEDIWSTGPAGAGDRCIVSGIGSTAFARLLAEQSANATMSVALGKLPWGFSATAGGPVALSAWEAIVWGDNTYCTFVLASPPSTTWAGVAGFIKSIFRWQAPPTQSMQISGIEASQPYDTSFTASNATAVVTYTGMMNAAAQYSQNKITDLQMVAGQLAFASATTNNQSVNVDFASWVMDSGSAGTNTGIVLGNVSPGYNHAESVYYVVDNGDGTVAVRIAAAGSVGSGVTDSFDELTTAWTGYQKTIGATKPVPVRCGGALFLNYYFGEPVPAGKCDDGLSWGNATKYDNSRPWSAVGGTTAPMNTYMRLPLSPYDATKPYLRGRGADDMKPVISETYIHTAETPYGAPAGLTVIDNAVIGTGTNQINYAPSGNWSHATVCYENYRDTGSSSTTLNDTATMTFNGTQVQVYAQTHANHGIAAVSIDNGVERLADTYSPTRRGYQLVWTSPNLVPGTHTIKIRNTNTRNPLNTTSNTITFKLDALVVSSNACTPEPDVSFCYRQGKNCGAVTGVDNCGMSRTVAFCGACSGGETCGGGGPPNVCGNGATVDNIVTGTGINEFNLTGAGWNNTNYVGYGSFYNSSYAYNGTTGSTASVLFTGQRIKVYGVKGPTYGKGLIKLDGVTQGTVDFYNGSLIGDQLMWSSSGTLAAGNHTVSVVVDGSKNAASTGYTIALDRVAVVTTVACTAESNANFCARLAKNCGQVTGLDNCGTSRTVTSCGTCVSGQSCGDGVCASSAGNLFTNPSFMSGTTGWTTYFTSSAASIAPDATASADGDGKSAKIAIGTYSGAWDNLQLFQTRTATGRPYTLTANFRRAEATNKAATVYCSMAVSPYTSYGSTVCTSSSSTTWQACSVTCTPPAGVDVKFGIGVGASSIDVHVDNMSLTSATATATCTAESNTSFCARLAKNCGQVTALDNCGMSRTVASCGTCTSPATCGGAGSANVCGTSSGQAPYGGSARAVPGTIQAEDYDTGGPGVAFSDTTSGNNWPGTYRSDDVDIQTNSCGAGCYNIGLAATGEWVEYTVNAPAAGSFTTSLRVSTNSTGKKLHLEVDGVASAATTLPDTGGYAVYQTVAGPTVSMSAGTHVVKVVFETSSLNLDWFSFAAGSCSPETDAAFCSRLAKNCGSVTGSDNCGASRTVSSCGSCTSPQTCGGGGTANVCGSAGGSTCAAAYAQANCTSFSTGSQVSRNGRNWTCANGNCMNCATHTTCEPGNTGCPWGVVWTDNGACN